MKSDDKWIERARYDTRSELLISGGAVVTDASLGSRGMPAFLSTPYIFYEEKVIELINSADRVLELCSGSGEHTRILLKTGADVVASDISPASLRLLMNRFNGSFRNIKTTVADMESLPFDTASFDVVACAGGISYGDPVLVYDEIRRILRPGGKLICVDSLNCNPVYRINRWIHYLRGNRSRSTLSRMPNLDRIRVLHQEFQDFQVEYFGALTFAMPVVARLINESVAKEISDRFDHFIGAKRSAFKFVLCAQGFLRR
jgi:ubiquinone/menaquinone biosynthesis C-methylase UbiE